MKRLAVALALFGAVVATAADAPKDDAMTTALPTLIEMNAELADAVHKAREQNERLHRELQTLKTKLACV